MQKNNLKVICDSAQAVGAKYNGKHVGTLGDIGGYSLNYHKHIHTGEGGIIITNNDYFARRMQLLRNHAETIINKKENLSNMIGHNYRLGEIEAAIGIEQLKKLNKYIKSRVEVAKKLNKGLNKLKGIRLPKIKKSFENSFYVYPIIIDYKKLKKSKNFIFNALKAEGVPALMKQYINLHLLPVYQKKLHMEKKFSMVN